ncbi:MAG: hypothetical protein R2716_02035 [Microthrixaceae bacterium]
MTASITWMMPLEASRSVVLIGAPPMVSPPSVSSTLTCPPRVSTQVPAAAAAVAESTSPAIT